MGTGERQGQEGQVERERERKGEGDDEIDTLLHPSRITIEGLTGETGLWASFSGGVDKSLSSPPKEEEEEGGEIIISRAVGRQKF
jgi:hypothetical protein